jgi:hypothetical protein
MREGMSFSLSFHQPLLGPSGAHWLDDASDLSCKDSTGQYAVDGPLLSCKQQVPGSSPGASSKSRSSQPISVSSGGAFGKEDVIPPSLIAPKARPAPLRYVGVRLAD